MLITEGNWDCKVLGGSYGADENDVIIVRVNVEFIDGPDVGKRMTYEERLSEQSAKYVRQSLEAAGWAGKSLVTLSADLKAETITTAEVVHLEAKRGKNAGNVFAKIRNLGRGQKPLADATPRMVRDADELLNGIPF